MECEFQDGGHRLWEGTATLETLDRGSIGVVPLDGQRGIFQQTESANVQMVCAVVFVEKSGLQNVKVLDKLAGKKLLALAPGHLFTEMQGGEGAAPGSHGKSGLCTPLSVSFLE